MTNSEKTQFALDLINEECDFVSDTARAVGAEIREVLADLRRVDIGERRQLIARDLRGLGQLQIGENLQVHRETVHGGGGNPAAARGDVLLGGGHVVQGTAIAHSFTSRSGLRVR